jgi:hypothetical protein
MVLKQGASEDVYDAVLQRLSDMVKATLPKSQDPAVAPSHPSVARLNADAIRSRRLAFRLRYALAEGR